ncbi:coil containing protein, partial [Vibrio phage 1.121.O._10N.286.46.C4]
MANISKEQRLAKKVKDAELKMEEIKVQLKGELTAANEKLVKNYIEYINFLDDVAQGRVKEATVAARINACDKLIKRVDELREELEMDGVDPASLEGEEALLEAGGDYVNVGDLITIDFAASGGG